MYDFPKYCDLPEQKRLPNPLEGVSDAAGWESRRGYYKEMLAHYLYGHLPEDHSAVTGEILESCALYGGAALRERIMLTCADGKIKFEIYVVRPADGDRHPVITWNCFEEMIVCPIEQEAVAERGYAIVMFKKTQLTPDEPNSRGQFYDAFPDSDAAAIAVWAWGHIKIADWLQSESWADTDKLIATGHSRGGKAALCAGIFDERFALVMPNNSGCGGSGAFRFLGGRDGLTQDPNRSESAGRIQHVFPHWFSENFLEFGDLTPPFIVGRETRLPFDMNLAKALVAPRALLTCEAYGDEWANTFGSYLTWADSKKVYALYGAEDRDAIFYHEGVHCFSHYDWSMMLDFADDKLRHMRRAYKYQPNNAPDWDAEAQLARIGV